MVLDRHHELLHAAQHVRGVRRREREHRVGRARRVQDQLALRLHQAVQHARHVVAAVRHRREVRHALLLEGLRLGRRVRDRVRLVRH